jgi:hypothetical protein
MMPEYEASTSGGSYPNLPYLGSRPEDHIETLLLTSLQRMCSVIFQYGNYVNTEFFPHVPTTRSHLSWYNCFCMVLKTFAIRDYWVESAATTDGISVQS